MRRLIARELRRAHRRIQPGRVSAGDCDFRHGGGACLTRVQQRPAQIGQVSKVGKAASRGNGGLRCDSRPRRVVRKLARKLAKMTLPEREAVPGIGPRRAEIIVAGAQVFAELLESFGLPGFRYSPLGLRDGILAQMLAEQDARATAHREFEHRALGERLATARRYGVDPRQAEPVRAHAVQLFRDLKASARLAAGV